MNKTITLPWTMKSKKSNRLLGGISSTVLILFIPCLILRGHCDIKDFLIITIGLGSFALLGVLKLFQSVRCSEEGFEQFRSVFSVRKIPWSEIEKAEFIQKTGVSAPYGVSYPYSVVRMIISGGKKFELIATLFSLDDILVFCGLLNSKAFDADVDINSRSIEKAFDSESKFLKW